MSQATVERACVKLRSAIGDGAFMHTNIPRALRDMLEVLEAIQPVVKGAEIMMFMDKYEAEWLQRALSAAYKIIDTVDELQDARSRAAATMMLPPLAIELAELLEESRVLSESLAEDPPSRVFQEINEQRKTGAVFEEAMALGRGSDKERIMAALLSTVPNTMQEHNIILPIFGFAGSGKTTLAQMVFNDTVSLQGYDFRVWIHVSPKLDFHTIGKSIICQVSGWGQEEIYHSSSDMEGMENTMKRLHKLLNGKKVLLVLDDLWEEDPSQLQLLKSMLTFLGDKMDVIVTTCNKAIARKICSAEPYRLNRLSDDTCWEIIKKSICFEGGEEELEMIGQEIGSKCQGVPSVARAYAGMLGSSRDAMTWKQTLEKSWIYESTLDLTFSTFELSYRSMPPDLRLCFAYCCQIFPTNHIIIKDDLVHQWIALQLIEPSEILSATQIAEEHITRLQDLSFLQTAELNHASGKDDKGVILFTVHAFVHDYTKRFLASLNYRLVTNHHGEFEYGYKDKLRALRCVGCSKLEFDGYLFAYQKYLRVLELKESPMQKLPDSICQLRHLGYLQISEFSGLVSLPESFGDMKNLFHVNLSGCSGLINLPGSFGQLICLVHVDLSSCSGLVTLPRSFGVLINVMHVNLSGCSGLVTLPESFGKLVNLARINLSGCSGLTTLPESFGKLICLVHVDLSGCSGLVTLPRSFGQLINVMHVNLSGCSGLVTLPESFGKLVNLARINLSGCSGLTTLPESFGQLINVMHVNLSGCSGLVTLPESFGKLVNLARINLSGCSGLTTLPESFGKLICLVEVDLSGCSGLVTLPGSFGQLINVMHVNLSGCSGLVTLQESFGELVNLARINLSGCSGLTTLPESFGKLISLLEVDLSGCFGLLTLPRSFGQLINVMHINLSGCSGLVTLPESFVKLVNLAHINLSGCSGLTTLPESFGKLIYLLNVDLSGCSGLTTLPESFGKLINVLHINLPGCSGLVTLPESFGKFVNLVRINLSGCSGLTTLPESFGKLIFLLEVDLSGCFGLVTLPRSFGQLIHVMRINLSGCSGLAALPESFGNLESMSHINLSRCHGLAELPEPLQKLRKLVHLDLSFWSCFKGIGKGLGDLTGLEHLNLSNPCCYLAEHRSHLEGLKDGLCKLEKLRYLNLSMCLNPIFYHYKSQEDSQYIGDCVSGLYSLEHLDLSHHTFLFDLPTSLGELNKLQTLNLSGCIRLKKVCEMKSLKFIDLRKCRGLESCHFVVRVDDDDDAYSSSNIVQLEEVNCQELQISCLEKVKSKEEAQRIKLVEKLKLQKLKLSWTLDTVGRVEDSALLRELVPPPNLQCLEVNGYTGTCLPEYLSDLTSLQELKIVCCKQLNSLPDTMQKLTSLKDLCILESPELQKWCQVEENKKMLAHIPNKYYEEPASTSRPESEEDGRLG